jgi:UDP-N-acetylglucosamine 2-epimerase (non-hydrolysing)
MRPVRTLTQPKRDAPLIAHVVGARPNYMKVAPVYAELERRGTIEQRLIHTGQHYDALVNDVFFSELPLPEPHVKLGIGSGLHGAQTARALERLEEVFVKMLPDLVLVPGDINSTLAGALAATKLGIPVCHLEAGLRSFDWSMPEEHNRRLTDHLSTLLLTHSEEANENLRGEGIPSEIVEFVGNTMIDTLLANVDHARASAAWRGIGLEQRGYVLVTLHRPALVDSDDRLRATLGGLEAIARELPVVFPVHPRTEARMRDLGVITEGLHVVPPLPYSAFLSLQCGAAAVVTDSGGVQEETTALGIPCFTLRDNTERPVTISHGTNTLLGLDPNRLAEVPQRLKRHRATVVPPLWDGLAGHRAADAIERTLQRGAGYAADLDARRSLAVGRQQPAVG